MSRAREPKPPSSPTLSIDDVIELHRDRWILMRVTEFDDRHEPAAGQVVAVSDTHRVVWSRLANLQSQGADEQRSSYYVFNAFPRIRSGAALHDVLETAAREGLPRGWWW